MEIKLKRNGWHKKLQVYVLGNAAPEFMNFCPYFWVTNFCIVVTFIIPIVPIIKSLVWLVRGSGYLFEMVADWYERAICEPLMRSSALGMDDDTLVKAWSINGFYNNELNGEEDWADYEFWTGNYFDKPSWEYSRRTKDELNKKFELWKINTPDWQEKLAKVKAQRRKDWETRQKEQEERRKWLAKEEEKNREKIERAKVFKQKAFVAIVKYTKWFAIALGLVVLSWIVYWVYVFINWAWAHFYYDKFITVMKYTGCIVLGALILLGIVTLFVKLFKSISCRCLGLCKLFDNAFCRSTGKYLLIGLKWVAYGIIAIGVAIGGFFKFFFDYTMAVKKDYCPGIVWEEDQNKQ